MSGMHQLSWYSWLPISPSDSTLLPYVWPTSPQFGQLLPTKVLMDIYRSGIITEFAFYMGVWLPQGCMWWITFHSDQT